MNTGIQDATNLAWKVALAVAGDVTGPQLINTYQEERHPVGADAVKFSGVSSTWDKAWHGMWDTWDEV